MDERETKVKEKKARIKQKRKEIKIKNEEYNVKAGPSVRQLRLIERELHHRLSGRAMPFASGVAATQN